MAISALALALAFQTRELTWPMARFLHSVISSRVPALTVHMRTIHPATRLLLCLSSLASFVAASDSQLDFPACPVRHRPEYFCCEISASTQVVYTRFQRPQGGDYGPFYEDGWRKARQINLPDAMYTPSSPTFQYDDPERMCRGLAVVRDGELQQELQCTFATQGTTYNASWIDDSRDFGVFWTSPLNPRNNNASMPVNAKCWSLMNPDGQTVNEEAKKLCTSTGATQSYQVNSFKEAPLIFIYTVYAVGIMLLLLWVLVRAVRGRAHRTSDESSEDSKKLLDERGGPVTPHMVHHYRPSLAARASEVQLRHAVEDVVQTGFRDSHFGAIALACVVLMTIGLNVFVVILVLDNTGHFEPKLFDPMEVIIKVYIALWVITSVWLATIVTWREQLLNFFRVPCSLDRCTRLRMFKPENTEILLADRSGVSQLVGRVEKFFFPRARQGFEQTVVVKHTNDGARYVEFQHLRYTYDDGLDRFVPGSIELGNTFDQLLMESDGLSDDEHMRRLDTVGRNVIEVEMPSLVRSLVDEFFSFFYIYQLMCYYVWYFTDYTYVAALNTIVILVAATVNIATKRQMMASIVQMTHYQCDVVVKRDGQWKTVKSSDVVPGDLVQVGENWELPCDMVIVKGSTVCDESMLTGESMPVQKFPIPDDATSVYSPEGPGKKYTLFSGTKTLSSGRNEEILAIVQSTGAHTSRGQLVQSILFPAPMRFKYDEHLKAMVAFLFCFGLVAAYLAMKFLIGNAGLSNTLFAFVYGTFMFSAVLNPLLPVVITVGQVNAAKRLQKRGVFCLNPHRITLCGKVRVFCFDKTGTITKQGLDYRGCLPVADSAAKFEREYTDMTSESLSLTMKFALASCHAVGSLNGELVGNEVEVKMFRSTQWELIEREGQQPVVKSPDGNHELQVVKRFEFDHHRMSMSVVMRHISTGRLYVFCKGSYERIMSVSKSESVPSNYMAVAESLAKNGCYVLGMATRQLPDLSEAEVQMLIADRDKVESNVDLLGLIMFRNELKDDSQQALLTLKDGDIRPVMITGDNAMTGCYIARASGMVDADARVILGSMLDSNPTDEALTWRDVDTEESFSLDQIFCLLADRTNKVELAVTGKAFDRLVSLGEIHKLLLHIRIFSRMTPHGKVQCVKLHMESGAVTGMCGDGGNDCGALRIAHVGVALSEAEASVVSPFTSKTKSLESVIDLVLEGRGALATSFGSVKFLILYGLIGIGLRFVMYYNGVFVSQFSFMYCDGTILVGLAYGITRSKPLEKLGKQRPTSSLVGPTTVCSLVGQTLIHILFLYFGIRHLMVQPWYCPFSPDNVNLVKWWLLQDSTLSSSLWFLICFQQTVTAITCSLGSRFRRPVWHNTFLMVYYASLIIFLVVLFVGPPNRLTDQFRIASSTNVIGLPDIPLPSTFRWELLAFGVANSAAAVLFEGVIILGPVRTLLRARFHKDSLQLKL